MTANIFICQSEHELEQHFADFFIAHIDGTKTKTLRQFYEEIADLFEVPDFGYNLDALNDALNDLQWLEDEHIVVYITNTTDWISHERDPDKMGSILNILDASAEDWKWADDDELADKKELVIVFEDSPRIRQLLDKEGINYGELSEF